MRRTRGSDPRDGWEWVLIGWYWLAVDSRAHRSVCHGGFWFLYEAARHRWVCHEPQGLFLFSPEFVAPMADEEVSDPKALLEDRSKAKCVSQWYEYQKCVKRIENDESGHKHCTGQYFDYWKCVDKNVAEKLFDLLK
nr:unnamed protein product [Digitaria exilis]